MPAFKLFDDKQIHFLSQSVPVVLDSFNGSIQVTFKRANKASEPPKFSCYITLRPTSIPRPRHAVPLRRQAERRQDKGGGCNGRP